MMVYYSPLSSILPTDALPDALGFVKNGLQSLLDDVYFKDFQHSESPRGDAAQYALTIVSLKEIELEIPGTGIALVLNPGADPNQHSEFPIHVRYEWPVLAWLRGFDLDTFSWQPADFYQLVLTVLGISERQVLERALLVFTGSADPIGQFVADYNAFYKKSLTPPNGPDPVGELQTMIEQDQNGEVSSLIVFAVYILDKVDVAATEKRLEDLFSSFFGGSVKDWFLRQITPKAEATLQIGAAIRFPRKVLVPLDANGKPIADPNVSSMLTFTPGLFTFSTETGIGYDQSLGASLNRSQIGDSGFEIAITNAKLDLSTTTNIAEATADGRPPEFVGVFIENATIKLPPFLQQQPGSSGQLVGRNLLIGTGGVSGTIALEATGPNASTPSLLEAKLGSFAFGLSAVSVTFQQNAITASSIKGSMRIPAFKDAAGNDAEIGLDVSIGSDGDFSVTASEEQGIDALRIPNVLALELKSLSLGRKEDRFFVSVSGALDFEAQPGLGKFIPDKIELQKLTIWDDGQIELEGGSIVLPSAATLQVGPVAISITAIHFGSLEQNGRKYAFFGFDGGVSIDPGGVDARGDGIKFYFTVDGGPLDVFLRITSLAIDIVIPGSATPENAAVLMSGYLAMKDDGEYAGGISVSLPKLSIAGSAAMRYNPKLPSFLIDLGLEIATPILLGSTGLGLYGFRGLIGARFVAKKTVIPGLTEESEWWKYYKAKIAPDNHEGIQASKFAAEEGFSLGAGVTLATAPDAGYAFSAKLFFLLSLPEVFLLQGQGQVLKQRIGIDTTKDPPFFALIAISSTSIETAFGVDYDIPDDGTIAQLDAVLEMGFFWGNAGAWYINLGKDQPEDRRVQALLLTIFKSYYYLMFSSSGIRTGAGVSYELSKEIGPFSVDFRAWMDMAGRITFRPLQVGGSIEVGGLLRLSIFGFGFSISASASLSGEAPHPFLITGKLEACVEVLWDKKCVHVELTWTFDSQLNFTEVPLLAEDLGTAAQAVNVHTLESWPLFAAKTNVLPQPAQFADRIVPMDSYIDLELKQAVHPTKANHPSLARFAALGGAPEHTILIPPQKAKSSQVEHELLVESIEIFSFDPQANDWKPYDVYAAATPLQLAPFITTDLSKLPWGYWQKMHPAKHNKLRVLAQTPFSYMRPGTPYIPPEDLGVGVDDVFCAPEKREKVCRTFDTPGKVKPGVWYSMPDVLYRVGAPGAEVTADHGLCVEDGNTIRLLFPKPTARAELLASTESEAVEVTWYRREGKAAQYEWKVVRIDEFEAGKLATYDDLAHPILRADVRGIRCTRLVQHCTDRPAARGIAENWLAFLEILRQRRLLLAPSFTLDRELHALIGAEGSSSVRYEATFDREKRTLFIRLQDALLYDCILRIDAYQDSEKFERVEIDEKAVDAFFLIANARSGDVRLRVTSCRPLRECHRGCRTCLRRVCWETVEDAIYNDGLPSDGEVESEAQAMVEALSGSIQPIWRPDTSFALKLVTKDIARRDEGFVGNTFDNTYVFAWRTAGPVGHFHRWLDANGDLQPHPAYQKLLANGREDEFKLATLQHYLDFARSYPNADGRLTNAKPLFFAKPRFDLFYLKPYVLEMYRDWDAINGAEKIFSALEMQIVDPAPPPGKPDELMVASFDLAPEASIPPDVQIVVNMAANGDPCGDVDPPAPGPDVVTTFEPPPLEPLKLYTAVFRNAFRRASAADPSRQEVHRYVFQTSRYADFAAQIGSWKLDATHNAVYEVSVEADAPALAAATALLTNPNTSSDELKQRFADPFDRLLDGIFRLAPLQPATTTEFNILRLAGTTRVLGILVRNPEPFNDPKMPAAELGTTVRLTVDNDPSYSGLHAKDAARVFVTNASHSMKVPPGLHHFTFDFRRWNGKAYVNDATATASFPRN